MPEWPNRPVFTPLVAALGPDEHGDFGFHQGLGEHPNTFSEHIPILLLEQLANERRQIHPSLGHRRSTSVSSSPARENSRNDARWPLACPASAAYRISTTFWDSNRAGPVLGAHAPNGNVMTTLDGRLLPRRHEAGAAHRASSRTRDHAGYRDDTQ
jgi:hypothetical protein